MASQYQAFNEASSIPKNRTGRTIPNQSIPQGTITNRSEMGEGLLFPITFPKKKTEQQSPPQECKPIQTQQSFPKPKPKRQPKPAPPRLATLASKLATKKPGEHQGKNIRTLYYPGMHADQATEKEGKTKRKDTPSVHIHDHGLHRRKEAPYDKGHTITTAIPRGQGLPTPQHVRYTETSPAGKQTDIYDLSSSTPTSNASNDESLQEEGFNMAAAITTEPHDPTKWSGLVKQKQGKPEPEIRSDNTKPTSPNPPVQHVLTTRKQAETQTSQWEILPPMEQTEGSEHMPSNTPSSGTTDRNQPAEVMVIPDPPTVPKSMGAPHPRPSTNPPARTHIDQTAQTDPVTQPTVTFPLQLTPSERTARLQRLERYVADMLEPLRSVVRSSPYAAEIPARWFYYSFGSIYGPEDRAFKEYICNLQPSLISAFLTADVNLLGRDHRTRSHHVRQFARKKYGIMGGEVAAYLHAPSLSALLVGIREYLASHPPEEAQTTLDPTGPRGMPIVYSHFITPRLRPLLKRSDQLTGHLTTP